MILQQRYNFVFGMCGISVSLERCRSVSLCVCVVYLERAYGREESVAGVSLCVFVYRVFRESLWQGSQRRVVVLK